AVVPVDGLFAGRGGPGQEGVSGGPVAEDDGVVVGVLVLLHGCSSGPRATRTGAGPGQVQSGGQGGDGDQPGRASSSTTCMAASSAEAAAPSMPTSVATRASSSSSWAPSSGATRRPERTAPTSLSRSSPSLPSQSPRPSPSGAAGSGSSSASRWSRVSPRRRSAAVTPGCSTAQGRSGGDQPRSRGSSTPSLSRVSSASSSPASS